MITARAANLATINTTWTLAASFTLAQLTNVTVTETKRILFELNERVIYNVDVYSVSMLQWHDDGLI